MKEFLNNYLIVILLVFFLTLSMLILIKCHDSKPKVIRSDVDSILRQDSIRQAELESKIYELSKELRHNDSLLKLKSDTVVKYVNRWHTIVSPEVTNDTILLADTIINTQQEEINLLTNHIKFQDSIDHNKDLIIELKEGTISELLYNVEELEYNLSECNKKRSNWWNRNKFWVGIGVGAVTMTAASFGISSAIK